MTGPEIRDFNAYLRNCSDDQVLGVLEKERAAGRDDYAALAEAEAQNRMLYVEADDHGCEHPRVERGECADCGARCSRKDMQDGLCYDAWCPLHGDEDHDDEQEDDPDGSYHRLPGGG